MNIKTTRCPPAIAKGSGHSFATRDAHRRAERQFYSPRQTIDWTRITLMQGV